MFDNFPRFDINSQYYLREPRVNDQDAKGYFECYNDPLVNRFIPDDCIPKTVDDAKNDLSHLLSLFQRRQSFFWLIARKDNDEVIGNIGYHEWNRYHNRAEIAYELRSDYWRQGIVGAATQKVLDFAFQTMRVARVQATTVTDNYPSMQLLKKFGFTQEGILSKYKFYKGDYVDIVIFGYSYDQYREHQSQKLLNLQRTRRTKTTYKFPLFHLVNNHSA